MSDSYVVSVDAESGEIIPHGPADTVRPGIREPKDATEVTGRTVPGGTTGKGVAALFSSEASGPMHVGHQKDKHQLGVTKDGEPVNAGHLSTDAYFYRSQEHDAPLKFEGSWKGAASFPLRGHVHLVYDGSEQHNFAKGNAPGIWRWYAEVPEMSDGPPPTGGPGPKTPPWTPYDPETPRRGPATPNIPVPYTPFTPVITNPAVVTPGGSGAGLPGGSGDVVPATTPEGVVTPGTGTGSTGNDGSGGSRPSPLPEALPGSDDPWPDMPGPYVDDEGRPMWPPGTSGNPTNPSDPYNPGTGGNPDNANPTPAVPQGAGFSPPPDFDPNGLLPPPPGGVNPSPSGGSITPGSTLYPIKGPRIPNGTSSVPAWLDGPLGRVWWDPATGRYRRDVPPERRRGVNSGGTFDADSFSYDRSQQDADAAGGSDVV